MEIAAYNIFQFLIIGAAVGFLGGFLGVGGGIIMIPLLIFWAFPALHVPPDITVHLSFGTSLAIVIPTSLSSSLAHSRAGNVTWRIVFYMVITGLAGSYLGSALAAKSSGTLLRTIFGVILLILAIQMFFQGKGPAPSAQHPYPGVFPIMAVGFFVGFFSGFLGLGGGVVAIPLMVRFLGISIHRAVGISISFVFFASLVGTAGYIIHGWGEANLPAHSLGYVYTWGWILVGIPSIFFAQWGAKWARQTKPLRLRRAFALLLGIVGIRMLWDPLLRVLQI